MLRPLLLLLVHLLLLSPVARAVEGGIRFGPELGSVRDDLLVPLAFGGAGPRVGGQLSAPVGGARLDAHLDLGLRILANRFGHIAASVDHSADLRLYWELWPRLRLELGPMLAWDARMNYLESWDNAHGYWLGSQWAGPALRWSRRLGASDLRVGIAGAVVGAYGRPPDHRFVKQDPLKNVGFWFAGPVRGERLAGPASLQALRLEIALDRPVEGGKRWSYGLDTRFTRAVEPRPSFDLSSTLYFARTWGGLGGAP